MSCRRRKKKQCEGREVRGEGYWEGQEPVRVKLIEREGERKRMGDGERQRARGRDH